MYFKPGPFCERIASSIAEKFASSTTPTALVCALGECAALLRHVQRQRGRRHRRVLVKRGGAVLRTYRVGDVGKDGVADKFELRQQWLASLKSGYWEAIHSFVAYALKSIDNNLSASDSGDAGVNDASEAPADLVSPVSPFSPWIPCSP